MFIFAVIILLFSEAAFTGGELCHTEDPMNFSPTIECDTGCCGDYGDQYCCPDAGAVVTVLMIIGGGFILAAVIIAIMCVIYSNKMRRRRLIQPTSGTVSNAIAPPPGHNIAPQQNQYGLPMSAPQQNQYGPPMSAPQQNQYGLPMSAPQQHQYGHPMSAPQQHQYGHPMPQQNQFGQPMSGFATNPTVPPPPYPGNINHPNMVGSTPRKY